MGKLYSALKVFNESICRSTLVLIFQTAGNSLNESAHQMLEQKDMFENLDDLIHNEHMVQSYHSFDFEQPKSLDESKKTISELLKLFGKSDSIKTFLVDDFFKRAKETIVNASRNEFSIFHEEHTWSMAKNFRKYVKLEALLDPMNLMLLSREFLEQGFVAEDKIFGYLIAVFDLSLIYCLLISRDEYSMQKLALMKHACYIVKQMRERVELFSENTSILEEKVLQSKIIKEMLSKITAVDSIKSRVPYSLAIEITYQIYSLKDDCQEKLGKDLKIDLATPDSISEKFSAIA